jgi:stage II sporulation protein R
MRRSHYIHSFSFLKTSKLILSAFAILLGLSALIGHLAKASANPSPTIPEDAIRIRIIANSDGQADQELKYFIKNDVSALISSWGAMPVTHDEAYRLIQAKLPEIQKLISAKLEQYGASYEGFAELAKVPFPDKIFAGESYAAGDYEALRITLGKGGGTNWWCVLFPPLCLTAATASDDGDQQKIAVDGTSEKKSKVLAAPAGEEPHRKFFLWEMLKKLFTFLKSVFS